MILANSICKENSQKWSMSRSLRQQARNSICGMVALLYLEKKCEKIIDWAGSLGGETCRGVDGGVLEKGRWEGLHTSYPLCPVDDSERVKRSPISNLSAFGPTRNLQPVQRCGVCVYAQTSNQNKRMHMDQASGHHDTVVHKRLKLAEPNGTLGQGQTVHS
jgi:hypothetical protein